MKTSGSVLDRPIQAVEMRRLSKLEFQQLKNSGGLSVSQLPTTWLDRRSLDPAETAVVSWRWDIGSASEPSMNLAAAICAAQQSDKRFLLFDLVSVAQDQNKDKLIDDIAHLSGLFSTLPVFAAYDQVGVDDWLPTMRRPWLFFEARAFYNNKNKIIYASHEPRQGGHTDWGFRHMLSRVWETNYTSTVLLVLASRIGIGELRDFAHIIPQHHDLLASACKQLPRNDFLLTAAILCQVFDEDGRFHVAEDDESLDLCNMTFDRYSLLPTTGDDHVYEYFDILLDGMKVAKYHKRTKPDPITSNPVYVRYLDASFAGGEIIHELFHPQSLAEYRSKKDEIGSLFSLTSVPAEHHIRTEIVRFYSTIATSAKRRRQFQKCD